MWRSTPNVPSTTPVGFFIDSSTGPCSMCSSRYARASIAFSSRVRVEHPVERRRRSRRARRRAACPADPSGRARRRRSGSPAAADDPSRLRPNRAPSSSAQSTSVSVTGGVASGVHPQRLERGEHAEAAVEPAAVRHRVEMAADDDGPAASAPGSVTQLLPAESVSTRQAERRRPCRVNHARASRHTGPHARRCAPSAVRGARGQLAQIGDHSLSVHRSLDGYRSITTGSIRLARRAGP